MVTDMKKIKGLIIGHVEKKEIFLNNYGVKYMFPRIDHRHYYAMKCLMSLILAAATYRLAGWFALIISAVGYVIPDILIYMSNASDNEKMLSDIESMYDIMRIQARAGVFIRDSLMDCYINSGNPRLKSAVLELCNNLGTSKTMDEAVTEFSNRFANRHIDVLCIVLSQAQTSGKTIQILTDMTEQINQLHHQRAKRDEGKLERKIEVLELMIFVGILAIGIYSMGNEILKMLTI